jgi:hypothetical protein
MSRFGRRTSTEVEVPIMDDLAAFTGYFVLDIDRAWDLVHSTIMIGASSVASSR